MPAKQPAAGASPVLNSSANSSGSGKLYDWFTKELLPLSAVLILVVVIFFVGFPDKTQKKGLESPEQFLSMQVNFANPHDQDRFEEFLETAAKSKDKTSENLVKAFFFLSNEYNRNPSADKRQFLVNIEGYLKSVFPKEAEAAFLTLPCREESCGAKFDYSSELLGLKTLVEENEVLSAEEKESIAMSLENAALGKGLDDKNRELNSLSTAFQKINQSSLNVEAKRSIGDEILTIIREEDIGFYESALKTGIFEIE